jgi:hypothetical protein
MKRLQKKRVLRVNRYELSTYSAASIQLKWKNQKFLSPLIAALTNPEMECIPLKMKQQDWFNPGMKSGKELEGTFFKR